MDPKNDEKATSQLLKALEALRLARRTIEENVRRSQEPIAIVGLGCRFPGGAGDPQEYWKKLLEGYDAIADMPDHRRALRMEHDIGTDDGFRAGFLHDRVDTFDAAFFNISPREAESLDPQQRLLLEVTWEALEDAGVVPESLAGSDSSVFIGVSTDDFTEFQMKSQDPGLVNPYTFSGSIFSVICGRISYFYGFQGPSLTVDTACSASLVSTHYACQSLRNGETRMALAGGVNLMLASSTTHALGALGVLSPDFHSYTFDARANGYARGEGCGILVLKRLSDAIADDDRIYAVIRGSSVVHDGRSAGLTAPNGAAQERAIRQALGFARVAPHDVTYVEAHGTGTQLGDPIEFGALAAVLREGREASNPLSVGSVKANIGHLEPAAGVSGLVKLALSISNRTLPPHPTFEKLNTKISLEEVPALIPTRATAWNPPSGMRFAGITSAGVGGTNAHALLGDPPELPAWWDEAERLSQSREVQILAVSAKTPDALEAAIGRLTATLREGSLAFRDVAYTSTARRTHFDHRVAIVAEDREDALEKLDALVRGEAQSTIVRDRAAERPQVAMVFAGQGAQWWGMARTLRGTEPVFDEWLARCSAAVEQHGGPSVIAELEREEHDSKLGETAIAQPALFAVEVALAELWKSWGVVPSVVVGHSVGEIAAAVVAGALTVEEGARLVTHRGRLMQAATGLGRMAQVELSIDEAEALARRFPGKLFLAASNGPKTSVLSGEASVLAELAEELRAKDVFFRDLGVNYAFHSPQVASFGKELAGVLGNLALANGDITFVSTLTGEDHAHEGLDPDYWARQLAEPVRFHQAIRSALAAGCDLFLEIGPHPVLSTALAETLRSEKSSALVVPSLRKNEADRVRLLSSLAALHARGVAVDWKNLFPIPGRVVKLPAYPWQRERFWVEPPKPTAARARHGRNPFLVRKVDVAARGGARGWELDYDLTGFPYLRDHFEDNAIFPGAGYVELALGAARDLLGADASLELRDITISRVLSLGADESVPLQIAFEGRGPGGTSYVVASAAGPEARAAERWSVHSAGTVHEVIATTTARVDVDAKQRALSPLSADRYYADLAESGLRYGPAFRPLQRIHRRNGEALAAIEPHESVRGSLEHHVVHPTLLDACFQLAAAAMPGEERARRATYLPVRLRALRVHASNAATAAFAHVTLTSSAVPSSPFMDFDLALLDASGKALVTVEGFRVQRVSRDASAVPFGRWLSEVRWTEVPRPADRSAEGTWLLLALPGDGVLDELRKQLVAQGRPVVRVVPGEAYAERGSGEYAIRPDAREDFERLLRALDASARRPSSIVHGWGLSPAVAADVDVDLRHGVLALTCLAQALRSTQGAGGRVYVATQGATSLGDHPVRYDQAAMHGMVVTLAQELPDHRFTYVDLDPARPAAPAAAALIAEIAADDTEDRLTFRGDRRFAARLGAATLRPARARRLHAADGGYQAILAREGDLGTLAWAPSPRSLPGQGEVEIEIRKTWLGEEDRTTLANLEPTSTLAAVGVGRLVLGSVRAVGPGVGDLDVGARVIAMVPSGLRASACVARADVVVAPREDALETAGRLQQALSLVLRTRKLEAGDRLLLGTELGLLGDGLEVLAESAGARTVELGASTAESKATFVVVRGGDLPALAWTTVEPDAYVVVIDDGTDGGVEPPRGASVLRLSPGQLRSPPRSRRQLLEMAVAMPSLSPDGWAAPEVVPASATERWTSTIRRGQPVIVEATESVDGAALSPAIRTDATYVVTGAAGDLGLAVAEHLVGAGAKTLVLVVRRPPPPAVTERLRALEAGGARLRVARADVSNGRELGAALEGALAGLPPVRGVVHTAGLVDDGLVEALTVERVRGVLQPKTRGLVELARLTASAPLDFFLCFSSIATILGSPGQTSYGAANAFMDAFAAEQRRLGRPFTSIAWTAWGRIGMAARQSNRGDRLEQSGLVLLQPEDGLAILDLLIDRGSPHVAVMDIDWKAWTFEYPDARRSPFLRDVLAALPEPEQTEKTLDADSLRAMPADQRAEVLARVACEQLGRVLKIAPSELDRASALSRLGVDSLMLMELRNRLQASLGLKVAVTDIRPDTTLTSLTAALDRRTQGAVEPRASEETAGLVAIGGLECLLHEAAGPRSPASPVVVLLHGFGETGDRMMPVARAARAPAGTTFVVPRSPLLLGGGYGTERWWWSFDILEIQALRAAGRMQELSLAVPEGLPAARARIESLLAALAASHPGRPLVLVGFSQGAMLALDVAFETATPMAGVAALTVLPVALDAWRRGMATRRGMPFLQVHGEADEFFPIALHRELHAEMRAAELDTELVTFEGGHEISPPVSEALERFLARVVRTG